ncbi:MAG TPA: glucoamylase family protein, partial [Lacunisphaera sp.]|nr:glucoamylase family protein [Lacunisphaera sp.]
MTKVSSPLRLGLAGLATCLVFLPSSRLHAALYDEHVLFQNSIANGPYPHSQTYIVAPSTLETKNGAVLVSPDRAHSVPNAVRLKWKSATGGDWRVILRIPGTDWRKFPMVGDVLSLWIYSERELTEDGAPRVSLVDGDDNWSASRPLVKGDQRIPAGQWVQVKLPLGVVPPEQPRGTSDDTFRIANTVGVVFVQGLDDNLDHTVYVDDLMLIDGAMADHEAPSAPTALSSRGYESHHDLSWTRSPQDDVLSYRIYRSWDGQNFQPVATQRGDWSRYEDFIGKPGDTAHYRVSAVDLAGNESSLSEPIRSTTRVMNDEELLDMVQLGCFRYYWEAGHPHAGMAPEIVPGDEHLMALGGNGFGVMALLAAVERNFITRDEGVARLQKIIAFLERAERYHGAWAHYLHGETAATVPWFGKYDNGGDLVETAFIIQGLLAARQYFNRDTPAERGIREAATRFWHEVEWDWYRQRPDSEVLYWHWSREHGFHINHPLIGWNESSIIYLLAIASPTHPVPASMWHTGWAGQSQRHIDYRRGWSRTKDGDHFTNGNSYYGIKLEVGEGNGAELFFTHFSFMGFDPRGIRDRYTNYFKNNRAIALIQQAYAIDNPAKFAGYGAACWGRSAGVNSGGGRAVPRDDNG